MSFSFLFSRESAHRQTHKWMDWQTRRTDDITSSTYEGDNNTAWAGLLACHCPAPLAAFQGTHDTLKTTSIGAHGFLNNNPVPIYKAALVKYMKYILVCLWYVSVSKTHCPYTAWEEQWPREPARHEWTQEGRAPLDPDGRLNDVLPPLG